MCVVSIRNAIASFVFMQDNDDHTGTLGCGKLVPPLATRAWVPRTTRDSSGGDRTYSVHDNQIESLSKVGTWSYLLNTQPIERAYLVPDQGISPGVLITLLEQDMDDNDDRFGRTMYYY